ncbi:MAG: cell division protein ZapB [Acidobacteriota bacterium]
MATDWLSDLEAKVQSAVDELKAVRKENASQKKKIGELEKKLADAQESNQSSGDWEKERDEIRKRVEKLASGLEKLV